MENFNLLEEHGRYYRNFDKCMEAIEDIILIASKTNNIEIGNRIARLLDELEPDPIRELGLEN